MQYREIEVDLMTIQSVKYYPMSASPPPLFPCISKEPAKKSPPSTPPLWSGFIHKFCTSPQKRTLPVILVKKRHLYRESEKRRFSHFCSISLPYQFSVSCFLSHLYHYEESAGNNRQRTGTQMQLKRE